MGGSWSKFYLMLGAVESNYIFVIVVLCISTLLNVYYLLEIPARAFFKNKNKEVEVKNYSLMTIPTLFAATLTVIIFFYVEPIKNLTNLITSN